MTDLSEGDEVPEPRSTPIAQAATSHVGLTAETTSTKIRDVFIVIIAPFVVPGLLLAVARSNAAPGFLSAFSLTDIAFGFVAVAIAGTARATTAKSDAWMAFSFASLVVVALQTALAISVDTVNASQQLASTTVSQEGNEQRARAVDLASDVLERQPDALQWSVSLATGLAIMVVSFELIRREK